MERFVLIPYSLYQQKVATSEIESSKVGLLDKPETRTESAELYDSSNDINRIHFALNSRLTSLTKGHVSQLLLSPRIKLSRSDTIIVDGRDTFVPVHDFFLATRKKNIPLPDVYFTILDAAQYTPSAVINKDAKSKDRGTWIPFKI